MNDSDIFTPTDLQYVIPEVWSKHINELFEANLVTAPLFLDLTDDVRGGGDTINVPDLYTNTFSANNKSNMSEITLQSPATANDQLSVDTWKEVSFLIEDKEAMQVLQSYNMQRRYMDQAAYTVQKAFDTAILANYSSVTNGNSGTSDTTLQDSDIRGALSSLDGNDVPDNDRAFIFDPSVLWSQVMDIDKYYDASQAGWNGSESPMKSGAIGVLYGEPVFKTTQVPTASSIVYNLLVQKQLIAYAKPMGVRLQANYIPESLGTLVTADIIFGTMINRATAGYKLQSSS